MKQFASGVQVAGSPKRPLPKTEILWGSEDGGVTRFPLEITQLVERKYAADPAPLSAFGRAVSAALDRVWIMDEYFFIPHGSKGESIQTKIAARLQRMLDWMPHSLEASDIRILTKQHDEITDDTIAPLRMRVNEINRTQSRRAVTCAVEVRYHLTRNFHYVHDRFAIVDDELWHFGGTVGGFHALVSAASRGWDAAEHGADKFFEMAWKAGDNK